METSLSYTDDGKIYLSTDEVAVINRAYSWMKTHPDDVRVIGDPKRNDGCLYVEIRNNLEMGKRCIRRLFSDKRKVSEEQRTAARDRMIQSHGLRT